MSEKETRSERMRRQYEEDSAAIYEALETTAGKVTMAVVTVFLVLTSVYLGFVAR